MPEPSRHDVLPVFVPRPRVEARRDIGVAAEPFPLGAVALLPGPFQDGTLRAHAYLKSLDPDRLLHTFRRNVGLSSGVVPLRGSESPDSEVRGALTGHVLSALAQAFASTGDRAFSVRADYLVEQLALCQERARIAGYSTGYVSAFPEGFVGRAEARERVQAPYATLHRIMAGLLDVHRLVGSPGALRALTRMAAWVGWRAGRLTEAHRRDVLRTGCGGMNEVLANLYQLTGDPAHLAAARYFDHAEGSGPPAQGCDLTGSHVSEVVGAIREYHATGDLRYRDVAVRFWRSAEVDDLTWCGTYHMLELARQLFRTDPADVRYFDFCSRALCDGVLGGMRPYDFGCCHGTDLKSNTKHGAGVYFHDGRTLYVNLFIPSVLTWTSRGVSVRQETAFPEGSGTRLTIGGSGRFSLRVRVPSWTPGARLLVNGAAVVVTPGTYARVDRAWINGDVVQLVLAGRRV
ncbi:hypothetical protein BBK82_39445 [Lentzea guizhouensis]|uniref:Uncharacterized protein n=1 Tax=Lentzea guizhouensis TaxID=1586287 RepID=A0A1B2HTW4_9PSEU|nr:beta-L-arabinofuranosidase domain-containing protein [Lentzea guizhouensis]ANZ41153.1 hypothetical protein BBK82_39445 [Lentzea guizhouensis]